MLMSSLVSVCLVLVPLLRTVDAPTEPKVYQIELSLYHAHSLQGNIKKVTSVLSNPTITIVDGNQGRFMVGGENPIPHTDPLQHEPCGALVSMKVTSLDGKSCIISLNAEESHVQVQSDELLVQAGNQVKVRGKVELNRKMSVRMSGGDEGKQTWLDFTVSERR